MKELIMPIKDAIDFIKRMISEPVSEAELYCAETCYGKGNFAFPHPEDYALNTALKALENAEKYRWHDLRNDPADLPDMKIGLRIMAYEPYDRYEGFYYCYSTKDVLEWLTKGNFYGNSIVAWKYIEPFEEGDAE